MTIPTKMYNTGADYALSIIGAVILVLIVSLILGIRPTS